MQYNIVVEKPGETKSECIIAGIYLNHQLTPAAQHLDTLSQGAIRKVISQNLEGEIEQSLLLHNLPMINAERILLIGCGDPEKLTGKQYAKIIRYVIKVLKKIPTSEAHLFLAELPVVERNIAWRVQQATLITSDVFYQFNTFKSKAKPTPKLKQVNFALENEVQLSTAEPALKQGQAIAQGINLTKDISNTPANVCTPTYMADQGLLLAKTFPSIKTKVIEEKEMRKLNMGALLAVSQGSVEPAKLIVMQYHHHQAQQEQPLALIGKGVTFDSGGISIKPASAMDEMKYDMCGAAAVLGTLHAVASLELPINIVGIIACTENLPNGQAVKPGDIVTTHAGKTVEILNTDAEGRLVLCDAISYSEQYKPHTIIDMATLTGAVIVALGHLRSGLMGNNPKLAQALLDAGEQAQDLLWKLPLDEEYQVGLDSNFADFANISSSRGAGSTIGAAFLAKFINNVPWAHLDIAGTAWKSGKAKGATGRPVPALMQYIINQIARDA